MKKRIAVIGAALSLMPLGQPLVIGTGAALTTAAVMLSVPEKAQAESPALYYNRGNQKYSAGDYYGAISDYNRVIKQYPNHPKIYDAYNNRGLAKSELNDYQGGIADYSKAIEINPQYAAAYSNRGITKGIGFSDDIGACDDFKKAASLGNEYRINWLNSADGAWCRNMQ